MGYYRRGGYQFGSTRLVVKLEHLLFAGVVVVVLSVICLLISSVIQLGYSSAVNAAFVTLMSLLAAIPWYVFLATLIVGIVFLWLAGGAVACSLVLRAMDRRDDANFVGHWAPTFLILGLYNKVVKLLGHERAR